MSNSSQTGSIVPDVIIIGSGFGGSVAAARLTEAGKRVVVLERGPWRDTLPVRAAGIAGRKPLPRDGGMFSMLRSLRPPVGPKRGIRLNKNGYLEMWIGQGMKAVCTSNVGGGSHIWAALMETAPPEYWDGRADGLSDAVMAPHYERVARELCAKQPSDSASVPNHTDHAWASEPGFAPLETGDQPPMGVLYSDADTSSANGVTREPIEFDEQNGMFGSRGGSKSTVDALYLIPAVRNGLIVKELHEVQQIKGLSSGGYEIHARDLSAGDRVTYAAPKVIVCAGTMNSNALLLSSRASGVLDGMPALGNGLGANGDLIGKWPIGDRDVTQGTPSFGRVKIKGHEASPYVILAASEAPPLPEFLRKKAQEKASGEIEVVAMSQDAANGRMWDESGQIRFSFDLTQSPSYSATMQAFDALSEMSGRKLKYPAAEVFTAHAMGGCRVADNPKEGVVDGNGEVYGHRGLYVADASVFPQPVGAPPSLSIAAWSSHVAQRILDMSQQTRKNRE